MNVSAKTPIVIVGSGYVGLVTGVGLAGTREVRLVDKRPELIADLTAGRMPIHEPGLASRFEQNRDRLLFFTDLGSALADQRPQLVFVAVGTPPRASRNSRRRWQLSSEDADAANLAAVHGVVDELLPHNGVAIVMKSTVPPGTGHAIVERIESRGKDIPYLSCPEFLQEGAAFATFDRPHRIVVGHAERSWASEALYELHAEMHPWLRDAGANGRYLEMGLTEAECVKHASNLHLATRISFANEVGNFCEEIGADVRKVMAGIGADQRIGPEFLEAGVGYGGSCFEKDIRALKATAKRRAGFDLSFVDTVAAVNAGQVKRVVAKIERRLSSLEGAQVAILGLAFKPGTDDLRSSPAFALAAQLRARGAIVRAWDPDERARESALRNHARIVELESQNEDEDPPFEAMGPKELAGSALEAMEDADAVVLVTAWPEFRETDWCAAARAMRGTLVIDGRNCLSPATVRDAGLEYEGTGRESRGLGRPLPESATET